MSHSICAFEEQVLQSIRYQAYTIERRASGFYVRGFLDDLSGCLPTLQAAQLFCKLLPTMLLSRVNATGAAWPVSKAGRC